MKAEYISFPLMYVFYDRTIFGRATTIQLKIWTLRVQLFLYIFTVIHLQNIFMEHDLFLIS